MQDAITRLTKVSFGLVRARALSSAVLMTYLVFTVWELWPAFDGPIAFAERFNRVPTLMRWIILMFGLVIPYVVYVFAGIRILFQENDIAASYYGSIGLRRLQRFWDLAVAVLVVTHLFHVWWLNWGNPMLAQGVFDALYRDLSKPLFLGIYVMGLTAVCFQWAQGVATYGVLHGWVHSDAWRKRWRAMAAIIAMFVWLIVVEILSYFVTGARFSIELLEWLKSMALVTKGWIS